VDACTSRYFDSLMLRVSHEAQCGVSTNREGSNALVVDVSNNKRPEGKLASGNGDSRIG
jgi:hypothetical protein